MSRNLKVLVSGAAGFLGSHLCEELLTRGYSVLGVDNFYTGTRNNIQALSANSKFEFIEHDVTIPLDVKVNGIFNLACPASPIHYQRNPVETIKTSFMGSLNLLQLATSVNIKILQASTSEVYGDPSCSPQPEEYWGNVNPIGIRSCYDEGKRAAETLFFDFFREYRTKIKVARIFNTYGPRMNFDDGRVVSNFISQALKGEDITVYGLGQQTRSFCYMSDLIDGLIRLYESSEGITGPINLGNPIEFSMKELAEQVLKQTKSKSRIKYLTLPADDPKQRKPDISKAFELLKWKPSVELNEGLELTIADFRNRLNIRLS